VVVLPFVNMAVAALFFYNLEEALLARLFVKDSVI